MVLSHRKQIYSVSAQMRFCCSNKIKCTIVGISLARGDVRSLQCRPVRSDNHFGLSAVIQQRRYIMYNTNSVIVSVTAELMDQSIHQINQSINQKCS